MQEKFKNLPLRIGVGIILLNKDNKVFVAKRLDNPHNYWQMPQGGVDGNEKFLDAALRELEEETSVKNVDLIKEIEEEQNISSQNSDEMSSEMEIPRENSVTSSKKSQKYNQ